jgi:hypothetical protein
MSRIGQRLVVRSSVSIACISLGEVSIRTAGGSFTVEDPTGDWIRWISFGRAANGLATMWPP